MSTDRAGSEQADLFLLFVLPPLLETIPLSSRHANMLLEVCIIEIVLLHVRLDALREAILKLFVRELVRCWVQEAR